MKQAKAVREDTHFSPGELQQACAVSKGALGAKDASKLFTRFLRSRATQGWLSIQARDPASRCVPRYQNRSRRQSP